MEVQEKKIVSDLRSANKVVRDKAKRKESDLEKASALIFKLNSEVNKLKQALQEAQENKPATKKATKKKVKVEKYFNIYNGKVNEFKNGLVSVRKSFEVNLKKPTKEQLDKAVSDLKKNGSLVIGKRTYYTEKAFNELNK